MTREEAISRYIVPALKNTWNDKINNEVIKALEQEPKTGHWNTFEIFQSGIKETWYECTKCKWSNALVIPRNYCPNCGSYNGAKMESEG